LAAFLLLGRIIENMFQFTKYLITLLFLFWGTFCSAQELSEEVEYVPEYRLEYRNRIYNDQIHTINFHKGGSSAGLPIINLGGGVKLELTFDDFSMKVEDLNYRIVHCDDEWNPTPIQYFQYITGIEEPFINDYTFSTAFNQSYVQYKLYLPNEEIRFRISGNYLVYVYRNGDPTKLLLSHRFYVTEDKVQLKATIHPAFKPAYREKKHEIDFSIDYSNYQIINPADAIKVVLIQNSRTDNAINDLKPLFVSGNTLEYNHNGPNSFWAGNEQRFADLRNLNLKSENIDGFVTRIDSTHVFIEPMEERRMHRQGNLLGSLYGGRVIGSNSFNHTTASDIDYCMVYFYLKQENKDPNGDFYVFGELSNFELSERFKMEYEPEKKRYRLAVYLKQGMYNWQILYSRDGRSGDINRIENSFKEAENSYSILVYHKDITADYVRLIKHTALFFPSEQSQFRFNLNRD